LKDAKEAKAVEHKKKQNVLEITTPERTWVLCCQTSKDRDEWIASINKTLQALNPVRATRAGSAMVGGPATSSRARQYRASMNLTDTAEWEALKKGDLSALEEKTEKVNSARGTVKETKMFEKTPSSGNLKNSGIANLVRKKKEIGQKITKKIKI